MRSLDVRYEQTTVTANLFAAYVHQGKTILSSETSADAAETALSMFQQALTSQAARVGGHDPARSDTNLHHRHPRSRRVNGAAPSPSCGLCTIKRLVF
ncbi:hypothetical protein [Candidatus Amarolinea dominans]|uniref:hypothetical protein n=1 Tax=Candidatus Amarolinea dominans TaxID=3140696 RepID=UPI003135CFF9|nr:hypothetical protein [Anaerolineae bacterium]